MIELERRRSVKSVFNAELRTARSARIEQMGMLNLNDMFGKAMGGRKTRRKMTVAESYDILIGEEADKLIWTMKP